MTEYLDTWKQITGRERGMKIQLMNFALEQNEYGNRETKNIIEEELERVTHFKCFGTSTEEECCVETEITVRMGLGWRMWKKYRGVL